MDIYPEIEYAHNNLDKPEFNSLITLLLENYKDDINLMSDIAYYLHNQSIYQYDSILMNRCEHILSLPNNYTWNIYYQKKAVRQYSTGDTNMGFTALLNSICNVMKK